MGYNLKPDKPKLPEFTVGFVIFALIVLVLLNVLVSIFPLPTGVPLVIAIIIGWNIRRFYFGKWQIIQTAVLISFNNWLKK